MQNLCQQKENIVFLSSLWRTRSPSRSFPKTVCFVAMDSAQYRLMGDLEMENGFLVYLLSFRVHGLVTQKIHHKTSPNMNQS